VSRYRVRFDPSHPLATKRGYVQTSRATLYQRLGPGAHPCHWCQKPLSWDRDTRRKGHRLLVDHLDSDPTNDTSANLVPCCNRCNTRRNHPANIQPGEVTAPSGRFRTRGVSLVCAECGSTYVRTANHIQHYGSRFCSRPCRNRFVNREQPRERGVDGRFAS
jgi:hypothetical protein